MVISGIMDNKTIKNAAEFEIVDWAIDYIMNLKPHQLSKMTVDRLARELNISRAYLYYLFKTHKKMSFGKMSIGTFLRCVKILRALVMLTERPRLSVKEISKKLGFNTVDYFIRVFKNYSGKTPLKFRKWHQEERIRQENKSLNRDL